MRGHLLARGFKLPRHRRVGESADRVEAGFTLVELLIVAVILPVVIGAIAVALVSVLSLQGGTSKRISDSADSQIVSSHFEQDVQSAVNITTQTTPACGSATQKQLLGLEWNSNQQTTPVYQTVISYVEVQNGSTNSLLRQTCTSGASTTPTSATTVSSDISSTQPSPAITPTSANTSASSAWVSTVGVTGVQFSITEPGSSYAYSLLALPGANSSSAQSSTITTPTTSCGFATPGTGTYASTLCFVDFSGYTTPASGAPCQTISASVAYTPYTMTFCLTVSGGPVYGAPIPTYFAPPTSEAFLGNNGFYTGIPGDPALYQSNQGTTTTVTITNIKVLDSNGNAATGWEFVSGDAESTDAGESISWTDNQDTNMQLTLLPNSTSSQIGNACAAPTSQNPSGVSLTGVGTQSVKCSATVSSDKTGTVMLEAPAPTSLTVQMVGTGLQAIFLGLLLP